MAELFCHKHNKVHSLIDSQLERAFHALAADYAEATVEPNGAPERRYAGEDFCDHVPCPRDLVTRSYDTEGWFEWVNSLVAARREDGKAGRRG